MYDQPYSITATIGSGKMHIQGLGEVMPVVIISHFTFAWVRPHPPSHALQRIYVI